jgi:hypothetical protein
MYAYTGGDPINRVDPTGTWANWGDGSAGSIDDSGDISSWLYGSGVDVAGVLDPACQDLIMAFGPMPNNPACSYFGSEEPPSTVAPPPPTCDQVLTLEVGSFLVTQDSFLLVWDPDLAAQFVTAGQSDGVDPRLMASIATLESGHGKVFGGANNPFGLGPHRNFPSPMAAVNVLGISLMHLIGYGDNTVAKLYSGLPGISNGKGGFAQVPGYCQTSVAGCQAAGVTVSGFLSSLAAAPNVGLTAGNPNKLGFPCPTF